MYIHVKVIAGAGKEKFTEKNKDHFEISVVQKAERNMANKKVIEIIARYFKVPITKVRIVNGYKHPSKLIVVED